MKIKLLLELVMAGILLAICSGCVSVGKRTITKECANCKETYTKHFLNLFSSSREPTCQSCQPQAQPPVRQVLMPVLQQPTQMMPAPAQPIPMPQRSYYRIPQSDDAIVRPTPARVVRSNGVALMLYSWEGHLWYRVREGNQYVYHLYEGDAPWSDQ